MKSHPFKHLRTILRHRHGVIRNAMAMGIFFHALRHDLSKFSPKEFLPSARYYAGNHSPVYEERLRNDYFSYACQHHTKRNPHHWEYWTDFFRGRVLARRMPWKYAMEYVADMLSASRTYDPSNFRPETTFLYFEARAAHYFMHPETKEFVSWCLARYRDLGLKGLRKEETRKKYSELMRMDDTYIYETPLTRGEMPTLVEEE